MARALSIDTSFLIDLERERLRGEDGPAHRFLRRERASELCLSPVVLGELAAGYGNMTHPALWAIRKSHRLLPIDEEVAVRWGAIVRSLHADGTAIGANDLWIAAISIRHHLPLVTANIGAFRRIGGLEVVEYR